MNPECLKNRFVTAILKSCFHGFANIYLTLFIYLFIIILGLVSHVATVCINLLDVDLGFVAITSIMLNSATAGNKK